MPNFTDWQVHQLSRTNRTLRNLNRDALAALRRNRFAAKSDKEMRDAGDSFAMMANRMMFTLRVRRELLLAGREQPYQLIQVTVGVVCDACADIPYTKPDHHQANSREVLEPDPAHQAEVEDLLEFTLRTEERVSARCGSGPAPLKAFFRGIGRLTLAVLRQQQDLRESAPKRVPKIEVVNSFDNCAQCRKPMKTEDGEDNRTMP